MNATVVFWIGFHVLIVILLIADLGFFHRKAHSIKFKEACVLSICWIALSLIFNALIYFFLGPDRALQFFTGYIIEKSLSVDNLFIFLVIFLYFRIPPAYQHKILYWGIIGALFFRIALILAGIALISKFYWIFYLFGAILLFSAFKFAFQKEKQKDPSKNRLLRLLRKVIPVAKEEGYKHFFIKEKGKWKATSCFLALIVIENTDIVFALDSIPAIFAITTDPFIIYTSNVFAILGLRSLYFVLAPSLEKLRYIKFGLAAILVFIGLKMLFVDFIDIPVSASLIVILGILGLTVATSWINAKKD